MRSRRSGFLALTAAAGLLTAFTAAPAGASVSLWDQFDSASASDVISSQAFGASFAQDDDFAADDFAVPAGQVWKLDKVEVDGVYSGGSNPAASVNVGFYADAGALPGGSVGSASGVAPSSGLDTGDFVIPLSPAIRLGPGTYWVSVQANLDFDLASTQSQWFWIDRTVQAGNGAAWENPGGGFGVAACTSWGRRGGTCGLGTGSPDQVFRLDGTVESTTTLSLIKTATEIQASGTVSPPHSGIKMKVALSQNTGSGFVKLATNKPTLDGSSHYATSFTRPAGGGTCKVKARFPGDSDHAASSTISRTSC